MSAILLAVLNSVNLISLFYYLFGLVYIFNRLEFSQEWIESTFNTIIIICFITIVFDLLGIKIVDLLTTYKRRLMVDDRTVFSFPRPTSFFREPSSLGLLLGVMYSVGVMRKLTINYKLLIICGVFSFSFSFYLIFIFALLVYSNVRFKLTKTISIIAVLIITFKDRIIRMVDLFQSSGLSLVDINLSIVKRYIHPVYALVQHMRFSSVYQKLFGFGPGGYKLYLKNEYSSLIGSDLSAGYLLNIFGNYLMGFGILYAIIFILTLKRTYKSKEFLLMLVLLFQGVAVVHPVFLLAALKIRR